jgi:hypothetical protein
MSYRILYLIKEIAVNYVIPTIYMHYRNCLQYSALVTPQGYTSLYGSAIPFGLRFFPEYNKGWGISCLLQIGVGDEGMGEPQQGPQEL